METFIKPGPFLSAKDLWCFINNNEHPKFSSSNAPFVKLEHKVITKWADANNFSSPSLDQIKEGIISILEDLDHVSGGWRYSCRSGVQQDKFKKSFYRHEIAFQEKSDALMFKLRHP